MNVEMIDPPIAEPVTALVIQERAALALGSAKVRVDLKELVLKSKDVLAINSRAGREECHSYAMALVRARTAIKATSKDARDEATKFSKALIAEEQALIAITEPEEQRLMALRDAYDAQVEREKEAKAAVERARILAISERIAHIKGYHALALECRTADRVQVLLDKMTTEWLTQDGSAFEDTYQEFCEEAQAAFDETKLRMVTIIEQKRIEDAERAAVKAAQEATAARLREEQAATEAAAKKLADDRAVFEAEQAAFRATQEAARAAEQAEREAGLEAIAELARKEEAAQAARELAAYEAAIKPDLETVLPVIDAAMKQIFGEVGDTEVPAVVAEQPPFPTGHELIHAVAEKFNAPMFVAAEWLVAAADEIANFE